MTGKTLNNLMEEKSQTEYLASLNRAFFGDKPADYIVVDGSSTEFIRNATQFALDQNLISYDKQTSDSISDSQYTGLAYRLTPTGRKTLQNLPRSKA